MDKKFNEWLQGFELINQIVQKIHSERLPNEEKSLAMQRTGFENLPVDYVGDKGWKRRYNYMLLLKSQSEVDMQRLANLDWLDSLTDLLYEANKNNNYPTLSGGKKCVGIDCANALTYQENEDGSISEYTLQIYFDVRGGY